MAEAPPSTGRVPPMPWQTRMIPIVFATVGDPVASGFIPEFQPEFQPGRNITGVANYEASLGGKWVELLLQIAPGVKRVAIMFNPDTAAPVSIFMPSLETLAQLLKVTPIVAPVHSDAEIETAIVALGSEPGIARRSDRRRPETT